MHTEFTGRIRQITWIGFGVYIEGMSTRRQYKTRIKWTAYIITTLASTANIQMRVVSTADTNLLSFIVLSLDAFLILLCFVPR